MPRTCRSTATSGPRGQVTFYDATPKSYRWSVNYAVKHLNHIGAKVRFKKVSRKKAKLVLRHNPRQTQAGLADLGYRKGRRSTATFNKRDRDKYETAMLVVHELGHVLGLDHPRSGKLCAVMNPGFCQACHFQTRMQALYPDDPSGPVTYGAPVELAVPADPAAG